MEFKDEESRVKWNKFSETNSSDGYSNYVVDVSRVWAKLMQKEIEAGKKLCEVADKTFEQADLEGATGFQFGCAVGILSDLWKYGDELREWHKSK